MQSSKVFSMFSNLFRSKKSLVGLAVGILLLVSAFGLAASKIGAASGGDCSDNSIIRCGVSSPSDFVDKVNQNATQDLQAIYADYGLVPSEYGRFAASAKAGTSYTDGRIEVDGRTVATGTSSIGRTQFSYAHERKIGAGQVVFWESATTDVQKSNLPVLVLFNEQGGFEFAVLTACGNPISGNPSNPSYGCDNLNATKVNNNTYKFTTNANAGNGASIAKVVYDFGDGQTVEKTNPLEEVTHTYASDGNFQAKVTVYVNLPGGQTTVVAPAGNCVKTITVEAAPGVACVSLAATELDRNRFKFDATGSVSNGATISRIDFYLRDAAGKDVEGKPVATTTNSASAEFTVATPGTYTVQAYVISSSGNATSEACKKQITVKPAPTYTCVALQAVALNDKKTEFRFTVNYTATGGAVLNSADFSADGGAASNVVPVDGVVSKDYTFAADGSTHTVAATLNFTVGSTAQTVKCSASVTSGKTPMCPVPGKENYPVDSPECQYCPIPGKQTLPKDSPDCKEQPPVLPSTGADDAIAVFASISVLGGLGHYFYKSRRFFS